MRKLLGLTVILIGSAMMAFTWNSSSSEAAQIVKQEAEGIKFSSLTYAEALKLSEQTGKPIFIDCYTVWCGPCKYLAKNTFTNKEVGDFFNANFINIKVEMEQDADGPELSRLFKVRGYPTLLFINGKGELIKQSAGYVTPEQLLPVAKEVVK